MFAILAAMFKSLPKQGEIYLFRDFYGDPFETWEDGVINVTKQRGLVEVLEVKQGWVRYKHIGSSIFKDGRLKRSSFHFCYKKWRYQNIRYQEKKDVISTWRKSDATML